MKKYLFKGTSLFFLYIGVIKEQSILAKLIWFYLSPIQDQQLPTITFTPQFRN